MFRNIAKHCLQRLRYQHSKAGDALSKASKEDVIRKYDDHMYGGWKSAQFLADAPPKQGANVIGRWDWHAIQFLIALIPAGLVYLLAMWARKDMSIHLKGKMPDALILSPEPGKESREEHIDASKVEERLEKLEASLMALQQNIETKQALPEEKPQTRWGWWNYLFRKRQEEEQ